MRKVWFILGILMISITIFTVWDNILILDDIHSFNESLEPNTEYMEISEEGVHIHVNLDNLTMYFYKDGEFIKSFPVSGGKPSTPSPLGKWKIVSKDTWGEGFGGAWMGFNVPWGKYGIHGTVYPWFIGKSNSSKGCIRMKNDDVKQLYKLAPHGATVTIAHINYVFRNLKSGDIGSDVLEIQNILKKLNYFKGYPNGKYTQQLKSSVSKFQSDNGLRSTGVVNRSTLKLLREKLANIN